MIESRLSSQITTDEDLTTMKHILSGFKRLISRLEAIAPNHYDGLIMQCLGAC